MRFEMYKCDNPNCGKESKVPLISVTAKIEPTSVSYDLCQDCFAELTKMIKKGFSSKGNGKIPYEKPALVETDKGKVTCAKKPVVSVKSETPTVKSVDELTEPNTKPVKKSLPCGGKATLLKIEAVSTPVKSSDGRSKGYTEACEAFGLDKIKELYIDKDVSSATIAQKIGVPKTALDMVLRKNGISKRKIKTSSDSNTDKESGSSV